MNIRKYIAALIVIPALTFTQSTIAQPSEFELHKRKLSWSVKPAVVPIWNPCYGNYSDKSNGISQPFDLSFFGTGFLVNPGGYIVTSADVMDEETCKKRLAKNMSRAILKKYPAKKLKELDLAKEIESVFLSYQKGISLEHKYLGSSFSYGGEVVVPNRNVRNFPFNIKSPSGVVDDSIGIGNDIAVIKIPLTNAPTLKLGDSTQIDIQDRVLTVGFPNNYRILDYHSKIEFSTESYYDASVQEGNIASNQKKLKSGYPVLQVDIQAKKGSGGSPLIDKEGKVVGMLVSRRSWAGDNEFIPLAIPTSTIQEFINDANTSNNHNEPTDKLYQEGVELYFKKKYREAKDKFVRARGNYKINGDSAHTQAEQLIEKIEKIEANRSAKPWTNPIYQLSFGLITGGGVVGVVAYFLLRQKYQNNRAANHFSVSSTKGSTFYSPSVSRLELEFQGENATNSEKEFPLYKEEHRLGRDPGWADLKVPNNWLLVSNRHAILRKDGESYRIYDGDGNRLSSNGLWINEDLCVDPQDGYLLENGNQLTIGQNLNEKVTVTFYNSVRSTRMAE